MVSSFADSNLRTAKRRPRITVDMSGASRGSHKHGKMISHLPNVVSKSVCGVPRRSATRILDSNHRPGKPLIADSGTATCAWTW